MSRHAEKPEPTAFTKCQQFDMPVVRPAPPPRPHAQIRPVGSGMAWSPLCDADGQYIVLFHKMHDVQVSAVSASGVVARDGP
jgi:hypothetical protein